MQRYYKDDIINYYGQRLRVWRAHGSYMLCKNNHRILIVYPAGAVLVKRKFINKVKELIAASLAR